MQTAAFSGEDVLAEGSDGRFRGVRVGDVLAFDGIRYAAAPTGRLRLAAPQPVAPTSGVVDATRPSPAAPQVPVFGPVGAIFGVRGPQSEDCLTLDVRAPAEPGPARAVLVFVHGGGFCVGGGNHPLYGDGAFARAGVVEVRVNYRLGMLGFAHVAGARAPANRGLLDVIAALEWVRRNIAAFGGDPGRVTLAGQSAGAMIAAALLASPRAEGLFSRAILQSGAASNALAPDTAAAVTRYALREAGDPVRSIGYAPIAQVLAAQRRLCAKAARGTLGDRFGEHLPASCPWQPVIDELLPDMPLHRLRAGAGAHVPVLSGTTRDEGWLLVGSRLGSVPLPVAILPRAVAALTGLPRTAAPSHVEAYRARRPAGTAARILADVGGDLAFRAPAVRLAEARVAAAAPTFDYVLDAPARVVGRQDATLHGAELPYLFDSLSSVAGRRLAGTNPSPALGAGLRELWCRFVELGRPTGDPAAWPPYGVQRATAVLSPGGPTVVHDLDAWRRAVWTAETP